MKDLKARTRLEFYSAYAAKLRKAGASEAKIFEIITANVQEIEKLISGKCPQCGKPIARYIDRERQHGPSDVPGTWVMYRCSSAPPPGQLRRDEACDYMTDLREEEDSN